MNKNSYAGREYLSQLKKNNLKLDVISIGEFPVVNKAEEIRCGGKWKPETESNLKSFFHFYNFESLKCRELLLFLENQSYDICIQGGTGILKENLINKFLIGILNFHPGDLPSYRGCSAPEWQLYEGNPIISTCHLIDDGIDTGPVFDKKILELNLKSYEDFRASIYPATAKFVVEVINRIIFKIGKIEFKKQDEINAKYRNYIGEEMISVLKKNYFT
jgi:methionyl-tRNA formyltransferase